MRHREGSSVCLPKLFLEQDLALRGALHKLGFVSTSVFELFYAVSSPKHAVLVLCADLWTAAEGAVDDMTV